MISNHHQLHQITNHYQSQTDHQSQTEKSSITNRIMSHNCTCVTCHHTVHKQTSHMNLPPPALTNLTDHDSFCQQTPSRTMPNTHANIHKRGSGPSPAKSPHKSQMRKCATSALEKDTSKKLKRDEENEDEEQSGKGKCSER